MNKRELCKRLAASLDKSQKECSEFLDAILLLIEESLAEREEVKFIGFGTFKLVHRASRNARNPASGEPIVTKEKWMPIFVPGDRLKTACSADEAAEDE